MEEGVWDGHDVPSPIDMLFLFRLDRLLDDAVDGFSKGLGTDPAGLLFAMTSAFTAVSTSIKSTELSRLDPTYPGLDMVAGALPFLGRDTGDAVFGADCAGCGDACATRCRLDRRADAGGSVAPVGGLLVVLFFRLRALRAGVGVGGFGGGCNELAGAEPDAGEGDVVDDAALVVGGCKVAAACAWLAA